VGDLAAAEGREAAEGAHGSLRVRGLRLFLFLAIGESCVGTKTSGRPDVSDARTEAFSFFLLNCGGS
jgi:hypothetical protein